MRPGRRRGRGAGPARPDLRRTGRRRRGRPTALGAIEADDPVGRPGSGAVALGALPFDPHGRRSCVVPRVVVGRVLTTAPLAHDRRPPRRTSPTPPSWRPILARGTARRTGFARDAGLTPMEGAPSTFALRPERSPEDWCDAVAEATRRLAAGDAAQGRARPSGRGGHRPAAATGRGADPAPPGLPREPPLLDRGLRRRHARSSSSPGPATGSSPTPWPGPHPAAATPRPTPAWRPPCWPRPTRAAEHRHTIDMVHDTLLPWCSYLDEEAEPSIVAMANVQHLTTRLEGRLSSPPASVLELVAALHPTPAVGGSPRDVALGLIAELEQLDRGRYAGPVGWVDADGNGTWAVGIRSAELRRHHRPAVRRGRAWWPTRSPSRSWPRPGPSCRPCSGPSCGPRRRPAPAPRRRPPHPAARRGG